MIFITSLTMLINVIIVIWFMLSNLKLICSRFFRKQIRFIKNKNDSIRFKWPRKNVTYGVKIDDAQLKKAKKKKAKIVESSESSLEYEIA